MASLLTWEKTANLDALSCDGHFLCSRRDPMKESEEWVTLQSLRSKYPHQSRVAILGLGAGYHVLRFQEKFPTTQIVVFEPRIELKNSFSDRFSQAAAKISWGSSENKIDFVSNFKPAWQGEETFFELCSSNLLSCSEQARRHGLAPWTADEKLSIKEIASLSSLPKEEAKIWHCLRELVR